VAFVTDPSSGTCSPSSVGSTTQVNGMWGFPGPSGISQAFIVTSNANVDYWSPPSAPFQLYQVGTGNDNKRSLDGIPPVPRVACGWFFDGVLHPRVWIDRGGGLNPEPAVEPLLGTGLALYSARMPRANLAYACGDKGTVVAWDGGTWYRLPPPAAELPDLNSITAFDEGHVYVAGFGKDASWVWQWNGSFWKPVMRVDYDAGSIRAVGGTAPDDLWAVGKGNAWHLSAP